MGTSMTKVHPESLPPPLSPSFAPFPSPSHLPALALSSFLFNSCTEQYSVLEREKPRLQPGSLGLADGLRQAVQLSPL